MIYPETDSPAERLVRKEKKNPNSFAEYKNRLGANVGCFFRLINWFYPRVQSVQRAVSLKGESCPPNYMKNLVRNQKYNLISFLPSVLFNQFKFFYNFFYLVISVTQFYPPLSVGIFLITQFYRTFDRLNEQVMHSHISDLLRLC